MLREITILPLLNGFLVHAGCQRLAYNSVSDLMTDLSNYLTDPEKTEKRILASACNRKHTMGEQLETQAIQVSNYERLQRELQEVEAVRDDLRARLDSLSTTAEATLPYPPPVPSDDCNIANGLRSDLSYR